ncbi:MAG: hypothetical protein Q8O67_09670 [Deltaproteobacteria bacterium]|nr:hypothetical protein [Deltaproteobacteria bacterium]
MDLDAALKAGDDDAVDDVLDVLRRDQGPLGLAEGLLVVILQKRDKGTEEHELTGWQYRRAAALEAAAVVDGALPRDGAARALEAATLARDVLNDGEGATRALVLALRLSADDDAALKSTVDAAGGHEPAVVLLEKAAKRAKGDDQLQGRLRRALARLYEVVLFDKEKAFFEALKAARKLPEGITLDDAYRLALEVKRLDEAAAFFQSLGEEPSLPARARASAFNKLGAVHDAKGDKEASFRAFVSSLTHHETKAARKKAERLKEELKLDDDIPPPVEVISTPPAPAPAPVPLAAPIPEPSAEPVATTTTTTTAAEPATDPEDVEERLAAAMNPNVNTVVGPPPAGFTQDPSIPPPLPDDPDDVVVDADRVARDAVAQYGSEFEKPVFTDELKAAVEVDADDAVISEERLDPALRSMAEEDDSRRTQRPPLPPDEDEPSVFTPRVDATTDQHALLATATMPPAPPTALPSSAPPEDMPAPITTTTTARAPAALPSLVLVDEVSASGARATFMPAPGLVIERAVVASAPPLLGVADVSEISDRKKAKRERKKAKRRGHSSDPAETTTPNAFGASSMDASREEHSNPAAPGPAGHPHPGPSLADDLLIERASHAGRLRPDLSLGDEMPEPAVTAPGGNSEMGSAFEDNVPVRARDDDADMLPPPVPAEDPRPAGRLDDDAPVSMPAPPFTDPEAEAPLVSADLQPAPPTREDVLSRAQSLLNDGDVDECLACADALQAVAPGDPRVLRLAGRALLLSAPSGDLPVAAVDLVLKDAPRHGERAASLIRDVQLALPPARREAFNDLWLAAARAAGHDADRVHALLEESADVDGPDGPLFTFLDDVLLRVNDVDRRDQLYLRAWRKAAGDDERRVRLLRARIALLEDAHRDGPVLAAWAQLALEHDVDGGTRTQARRAHERKATPDERAKFLARLVRVPGLEKDEVAVVLRELLELRVAVDDKVGAESTARELLLRAPGDARATTVLADLLADDPRRAAEVVAALRARADSARAADDLEGARQALERLARALTTADRKDEAAAVLVEAVKLAPGDQPLVERVIDNLLAGQKVADAVDLLEDLANRAVARDAARLLLRGAELARERLQKRGRARELVEKAALLQPKDLRVLDAYAELLLEIGDAPSALAALEKIAAEEKDTGARARVHLRIGKLLEEHLQRTDDALKRYKAAVDVDKSLKEGWDALHQLARQKGQQDVVVDALTGLAALLSGREKSAALVKLGRVQAQERNDPTAAAAAFEAALVANASDIDALMGLLSVRALALQGERDVDAALAVPAPELVDELYRPLLSAEAQGAALPFGLRRLLALAVTQDGDHEGARKRFESLLEERGDDLPTLLAFARHLTAAGRLPGKASDGAAADSRRREVLEAVLLHHAYALKPAMHVDVWGEVCALRLQQGDVQGAKKAAKKALALVSASDRPADLEEALSDRAVRALVLCLEEGLESAAGLEPADVDLLEHALTLDLQRAIAPSEKSKLKEKQARIALVHKKDAILARQLLEEALKHDPDASTSREMLFDIELSGEDPRVVLEQSRALTATERDPVKKAALHLRLFRLQKKLRLPDDVAAAEIKAAVELDPKNPAILDAAEKFFADKKDGKGLDALYTTRLKSLDRGDVSARLVLLERLAQLRRYELRDLRAAIDACEAMSALDPDAIKPREDAARLHVELGQWKEAVYAWRAVLDRDTLLIEAWRGLFSVYARSRQADDAFAVASTMAALEIADDDMVRAVRAVRPPFPRWPLAPADVTSTKKKLAHPLERTAVRQVLELIAPRLLPRLGRPLQDFGVRRRDALVEAKLPASVAVAVRTGAALAGFVTTGSAPMSVPLYQAELGSTDGTSPPFAALPAKEPGLIVTSEVLRGGMTPERAFALGRAIAWLSPWALLAAALDASEIRRLIEGCVSAFLSPRDVEKPSAELERYGVELQKELFSGLSTTEQDALRAALSPALRDWVVGRSRLHLSDWKAGVGYSGDRLGFLLSSDLPAAVKVVRAAGGSTTGVRMAIRELVLFTISPQYMQLRRELSLALPEQALAPIIDLG